MTTQYDPLVEFGQTLRKWRNKRRVSQARLAAEFPVHRDLISKIENGRRWPTPALIRIADTFLDADGDLYDRWPRLAAARAAKRNGSIQLRVQPVGTVAVPPGQTVVIVSAMATSGLPVPTGRRHDIVLAVDGAMHTQLAGALACGKPVFLVIQDSRTDSQASPV